MSQELFYLLLNDEQAGPYTLGQLQSMWRTGQVTAKTHVWSEGKPEWERLVTMAAVLDPQPVATTARESAAVKIAAAESTLMLTAQSEMKSTSTAFALALFLPFFGALYAAPIAAICWGLFAALCIGAYSQQVTRDPFWLIVALISWVVSIALSVAGAGRFNRRLVERLRKEAANNLK